MKRKLRIIVTGMVAQFPLGGIAWDYLQYVIGFKKLGHDVYYHEDTHNWPYNPKTNERSSDPAYSVKYLKDFFEKYAPDLNNCWHYRHLNDKSYGMSYVSFKEKAKSCDIFLNVSGTCQIPSDLSSKCTKIFLDTDPGYNQIVLSEQRKMGAKIHPWSKSVLEDYDQYFTYAENIYGEDCTVPKLDINWKTTRMPIITDLWQGHADESLHNSKKSWTTVMTWNNFHQKLLYNGQEYGSKDMEFEKIISLPKHVDVPLTVAIGGANAPKDRLKQYGWNIVDGPSQTLRPDQYQEFICQSAGEFSTAKNVYVAMRSGWFSCRSACYLAAGKPVVVQDTGFSKFIPSGEGVITFRTLQEAKEGLERVCKQYEQHKKAASDIVNEYFDHNIVLNDFISKTLNYDNKDPISI